MKVVLQPNASVTQGVLDASTTFPLLELFAFYGISMQIKFTDSGSLAGTLTMEVSNDDLTYVAYSEFTAITSLGSATMFYLNNKIFPFKYARLKWVRSAGAGFLNVVTAACRV
jgi:hypothetical protein